VQAWLQALVQVQVQVQALVQALVLAWLQVLVQALVQALVQVQAGDAISATATLASCGRASISDWITLVLAMTAWAII
jgi:hypothetical protein